MLQICPSIDLKKKNSLNKDYFTIMYIFINVNNVQKAHMS